MQGDRVAHSRFIILFSLIEITLCGDLNRMDKQNYYVKSN